jgi:hypothetical protein
MYQGEKMNDLTSGLLVVVVTVFLIGLTFWLVSINKKQREQVIRQLASLNGWTYEPVNGRQSSGYRLRKNDWMIEALSESSDHSGDPSNTSSVSSYTRWFSGAARLPEGIVLIGPRQPEVNLAGMGDILLQTALRLMIGSDADQAKEIRQVELGSLEVMKRYMVWTNREEEAKQLLDLGVESALLNWPGAIPLVVKYSAEGVEVKVQGRRIFKDQELYDLVKIGNALLNSAG